MRVNIMLYIDIMLYIELEKRNKLITKGSQEGEP